MRLFKNFLHHAEIGSNTLFDNLASTAFTRCRAVICTCIRCSNNSGENLWLMASSARDSRIFTSEIDYNKQDFEGIFKSKRKSGKPGKQFSKRAILQALSFNSSE